MFCRRDYNNTSSVAFWGKHAVRCVVFTATMALIQYILWWSRQSQMRDETNRGGRPPMYGSGSVNSFRADHHLNNNNFVNQVPQDSSDTDELKMQKTMEENKIKFSGEQVLTLQDFPDLLDDLNDDYIKAIMGDDDEITVPDDYPDAQPNVTVTLESLEEDDDRKRVWEVLDRAGLKIDEQLYQTLPTWSQVKALYGEKPVIIGKEMCEAFREAIPAHRRYVGVAGQMNAGTNALAKLLTTNMRITANRDLSRGVLWTVPWYKHSWISLINRYHYKNPRNHTNVLPVVLIRDPYFWMNSMCQSPYTMKWNRTEAHCPNLLEPISDEDENGVTHYENVPVNIRWGNSFDRKWDSLAHVWSEWYREYYDAIPKNPYNENDTGKLLPRLMIRFEDILFHTEEVVEQIRECVGADWKPENKGEFKYAKAPSKTHPYFAKYKKHQSSLVSALIKYGQEGSDGRRRIENMTDADIAYAKESLDPELLRVFHYQHPEAAADIV